jgi:hypothetical protein
MQASHLSCPAPYQAINPTGLLLHFSEQSHQSFSRNAGLLVFLILSFLKYVPIPPPVACSSTRSCLILGT